jgi:hypothetical protein
VHLSKILTLVAVGLALGISGCAAVEASRWAEVEKQKSFEHRKYFRRCVAGTGFVVRRSSL